MHIYVPNSLSTSLPCHEQADSPLICGALLPNAVNELVVVEHEGRIWVGVAIVRRWRYVKILALVPEMLTRHHECSSHASKKIPRRSHVNDDCKACLEVMQGEGLKVAYLLKRSRPATMQASSSAAPTPAATPAMRAMGGPLLPSAGLPAGPGHKAPVS